MPTLLEMFLTFLAETFGIRNYHVDVVVTVVMAVVGVIGTGIVTLGPGLGLCVAVFKDVPSLESIEHPCGAFASQ